VARREPRSTTIHGHTLVDDYFWLRNQDSPEVLAYLRAENAYTDAVMKPTEPLQRALYGEMLSRIKEDDATPPYKDGGFFYYHRSEAGKQHPIHCRKRSLAGAEAVILDLNTIAPGARFVSVADMAVSDDDRTLAYLVDTVGFRQYTLKVKNLESGTLGPEAIPRVDSVAFARDGQTLFYVTEDPQTKRPDKLFRHRLGTDAAADVLLYEEKDPMFELSIERSRSRAYLFVTSASRTTTEVRVLDSARPTAAPRLIAPREPNHEYYLDHRGPLFYIRTNSGGRNFRIVTAPVDDAGRRRWTELVPTRAEVMLEDHLAFEHHLVIVEREGALAQLAVVDLTTGQTRRLPQPEPLFEVTPVENHDFEARAIRFRFESPRTPASVVEDDLDGRAGGRRILKQFEVPGYDASAYQTRRIGVPARDGTTMIPVSLVYKQGVEPDGTHPLLLTGYGAYGISPRLAFSPERVSLLDRGMIIAIGHVRGGGDLGKPWHDAGRMMHKMNTFTDFIDVAEALKAGRWARSDGLVISGGSAGGLLMGAVINLRPELFEAVVAYVPFVDLMNTMLDQTLPLTVAEFEEWGDPRKPADFDTMLRYSPYDNVGPKAYPAMLVRTSYHDSQVMYWEPAKWVARLRATKTDSNPLLLEINMDPAGHGGRSGRYDRLRDTAFDFAFMLERVGLAR
jgi:oligopeptidase B